ncbi:RTC4-like domain-containing protein [Xylaria sp. FL0933]|nr:RTC4-like domain-containing protein [Xylaria sp. FL0933]
MTGPRRSLLFQCRRDEEKLKQPYSKKSLFTQSRGENSQSAKRQKVEPSSLAMKKDLDPLHDPITAPPESSDNEEANLKPATDNGCDSDEEYNRRNAANIRGTTFHGKTSEPRVPPAGVDVPSSLAGSKQFAQLDQGKGANQLERELEAPRGKRKKPHPVTKYGSQQKTTRQGLSQPRNGPTTSASQESTQSRFQRVQSISPMKSQSPRRLFQNRRQISDFNEPEDPKPSFKNLPQHDSSPLSTPKKPHTSLADKNAENKNENPSNATTQRLRSNLFKMRRKSSTTGNPSSAPVLDDGFQKPVFKVPGMEDLDLFNDSGSLSASTTPVDSQSSAWEHIEIEDAKTTTTPTCPMCHQEVDRDLLEKHSTNGKMSVKQQTAFCRLHKRQSAVKAGAEKGYPKIEWDTLDSRFSSHQVFLKNILEGTQTSHYRKILKEMVESGKNRTLLKTHDNLTPGYYGPRGLQAMTQFIMRTLSDVIRRRAVEDKLISARTYTGYVQMVLVPELAVRLIMEDMSVAEERAREVLEESVEIGELLHEEARDVVTLDNIEEDRLPET